MSTGQFYLFCKVVAVKISEIIHVEFLQLQAIFFMYINAIIWLLSYSLMYLAYSFIHNSDKREQKNILITLNQNFS